MSIETTDIDRYFPEMVRIRRYLHTRPELSFHEAATAEYIAGLLDQWGLEVRRIKNGHSVIGILHGASEGRTVALRADIDALPIQDEKTCDYASQVPGVMHACGHDAHTSALLAVARWFAERQASIAGRLIFIFQHAEEVAPGGALSVIASGILDSVDVIYGAHLWTPLPVGHVYGAAGPVMAAADRFEIRITGKGGHGGLPHAAVDSIVVAANVVTSLQTIVSRSIDPIEPCVVSVGKIEAGQAFNVIAETCSLIGTVRSFREETRSLAEQRLEAVVTNVAAMHGASAKLLYTRGYPPVVNDPAETERFKRVGAASFGASRTHAHPPITAGEDFAYYLQKLPGVFLFVGAGNADKGIVYPHHHPKFDIDENAMLVSARLLAGMALDYLQEHRAADSR